MNPTHTRERRNERNEEAQERHPKNTVTEIVPGSHGVKGIMKERKNRTFGDRRMWRAVARKSKGRERGNSKKMNSEERKREWM